MRLYLPLVFGLALFAPTGRAIAQSSESDPLLAVGIRQFQDGDFEAALFSLDTVVRRLSGQPGREKGLVQAYLYLGAAYVGLNHEEAAKGKFREALKLDPELRLSADQFSSRVVKVFDSQVLTRTVAKKKRSGRVLLILGGVGAAAAVGVSAATNKAPPPANSPPTATIGQNPEGQVIASVTVVTFTARGSDVDNDPLDYRWDFGDGGTGSGASVTHRFDREGSFTSTLTVSDSRGGMFAASARVVARMLTGTWRATGGLRNPYSLVQQGASLTGREQECRTDSIAQDNERCCFFSGTVTHPRELNLRLQEALFCEAGLERRAANYDCAARADATLDSIARVGSGACISLVR